MWWRLLQAAAYIAVIASNIVWKWTDNPEAVGILALLSAIFATAIVNACFDFWFAPRVTKVKRALALSVVAAPVCWELIWHKMGSVGMAALLGIMLSVYLTLIVASLSYLAKLVLKLPARPAPPALPRPEKWRPVLQLDPLLWPSWRREPQHSPSDQQ